MFVCKVCEHEREDKPVESWDTCPNCDNFDWMVKGERNNKKWTTEPPTEPGLYWYTYKHQGVWQKPTEKRLSVFGGELCEEVCGSDGGEYEPIKHVLCSGNNWKILGPIPVPEPPKE